MSGWGLPGLGRGPTGRQSQLPRKGSTLRPLKLSGPALGLHSLAGLCQSPSFCAAVGCLPTLSLGMSNATRSRGPASSPHQSRAPGAGRGPVAFHFSPAGPTAGSLGWQGEGHQQVALSMMFLGRWPTSSSLHKHATWS